MKKQLLIIPIIMTLLVSYCRLLPKGGVYIRYINPRKHAFYVSARIDYETDPKWKEVTEDPYLTKTKKNLTFLATKKYCSRHIYFGTVLNGSPEGTAPILIYRTEEPLTSPEIMTISEDNEGNMIYNVQSKSETNNFEYPEKFIAKFIAKFFTNFKKAVKVGYVKDFDKQIKK